MRGSTKSGFPRAVVAAVLCALCVASSAVGQDTTVAAAARDTTAKPRPDQQELAKKLANPVSDLVSVPFQFNWENKVGPDDDGMRMVLNIQPVVPISLSEKWNLIGRWIMPYVAQPEALGSSTGFGDVVFSSFFSPAGEPTLTWGIGPVLTLPLSTDPTLGSGKWAAGPTGVVIRIQGPWVYGILANQVWSFADASSDDRADVNQAFIQPFLGYVTPGGVTYTLNSESTANWEAKGDGETWTVPIHFLVSKLTKFGPFPFSVQAGVGVYVAAPKDGPDWKLRTNFVVLLPRTK
jgi:hypothetical protein